VIGIDTNVLVRYLTQDDAAQARKVDVFLAEAIEEGSRLYVDDIVLCEMVWVLRGAYRLGKPAIVNVLDKVISTALFAFDDRESLRGAITDYRHGSGDFADYMIGRRNARADCEHTVTFDRALRGEASFVLL
jgi:predicted nucleic-acid-binding protein